MNGLQTIIQKSSIKKLQKMIYSSWQLDHFASSVFVFFPDGTIIICCFNVPGCLNNSNIAK
jgi:hypothetical protein